MATPFLAEIRIFACNFAPLGWAFCDGQLMPIAQNTAVFSLVGTLYGGNGTTTFALPNLQGNFPIGAGQGVGLTPRLQGQTGGEATHTLTLTETPAHGHLIPTAATTETAGPANQYFAPGFMAGTPPLPPANLYTPPLGTPAVTMSSSAIQPAGGGQAHENRQPWLALNFCIALQGVFPSRA
jgi:microcystin-dependent protein